VSNVSGLASEYQNAMSAAVDLLQQLDRSSPEYASELVDKVLQLSCRVRASDVHWQPTEMGIDVRIRIDGVLHRLGTFSQGDRADPIARLKVLANLLTYRTDVPQEGRCQWVGQTDTIADVSRPIEMRISTFPTLHGERVAVRVFETALQLDRLSQLGYDSTVSDVLRGHIQQTTGALILAGPAGSGKTTTAYALLREINESTDSARSIVTLEDPVEFPVPGIAQSQMQPAAGFTFATGLRSLVRQDPEVIFVGEMRDRETVEVAFQAALTGQLLISTFHADSVCGAVCRLLDLQLEPFILRSAVRGILWQRLVRRLCHCKIRDDSSAHQLGFHTSCAYVPRGCDQCLGTGYRGRVPILEFLGALPSAMLTRDNGPVDSVELETHMKSLGYATRWDHAHAAITEGVTSAQEIRRVLGFGP
jgi:type II secretory ATPase GspE/PulE/Tfp pilus assembly ATPase PilB-like protein